MNPRSRKAALYAIGVIAILAGAKALAHSYAGLYDWAIHHRLAGRRCRGRPRSTCSWLLASARRPPGGPA